MCGLTAFFTSDSIGQKLSLFHTLAKSSVRRGSDSSGIYCSSKEASNIYLSQNRLDRLSDQLTLPKSSSVIIAHSQLKTNCETSTQPFAYSDLVTAHNGINH